MEGLNYKAIAMCLAIVIVNLAAHLFGMELDSSAVTEVVTCVIVIAATVFACWKDHDFTQMARLIKRLGKAALDECGDGEEDGE